MKTYVEIPSNNKLGMWGIRIVQGIWKQYTVFLDLNGRHVFGSFDNKRTIESFIVSTTGENTEDIIELAAWLKS